MAFYPQPRTRAALLWMLSTKMLPDGRRAGANLSDLPRTPGCWIRASPLIVIYMLSNLPIGVWMLFTFFRETPKAIIEAKPHRRRRRSGIRSCHVLLPLRFAWDRFDRAAVRSSCSWNEAFWSLNLSAHDAAPLTAFIASFSAPEGLFWAKLSAAATLATVPILLFGWFVSANLCVALPSAR